MLILFVDVHMSEPYDMVFNFYIFFSKPNQRNISQCSASSKETSAALNGGKIVVPRTTVATRSALSLSVPTSSSPKISSPRVVSE
jgi:hypothetical protein